MNNHYNIKSARNALEAIVETRTKVTVGLESVHQLSDFKVDSCYMAEFKNPSTWHLAFIDTGEMCTVCMQGLLSSKYLPPIQAKSNTDRDRLMKNIQQSVGLCGLGLDILTMCS
ncbi:hypothetical protein BDQ12DRAFT_727188 [Crucibulum laeve]|uniref:Uncharacterized protein n=1 Tax=Crucibulum laeve TaxID=68775 RepID=A0A5C3LQ84_9AGAR|nr:hypothetical protein BDQ12DRAFT_727188 [Crucibulum laeve]